MKILVFSDSHGYTTKMIEAVSSFSDVDMILHLGDCVRDAEEIEQIYKNIRVEYVPGNNDWGSQSEREKVLDIEGNRILITHGNIYGVKNGYSNLIRRGKELLADAVFFGHTHIAYESIHDNLLLINPGSISFPPSGHRASYCVMEIAENGIKSRFIKC